VSDLFVQMSVSLDGFIEDRRGDIEWMTFDPAVDPLMTATLRSIDGMIFGRRAHELLAAFWPTAADMHDATTDLIEQAKLMNTLPKYVLTHGAERTGWANSHAISLDDVPRLKAQARRPLAVYAGASAAQAVLDRGFVDEIRLFVYPVIIGGGTRLFAERDDRQQLELLGIQQFDSGTVVQRYRVV